MQQGTLAKRNGCRLLADAHRVRIADVHNEREPGRSLPDRQQRLAVQDGNVERVRSVKPRELRPHAPHRGPVGTTPLETRSRARDAGLEDLDGPGQRLHVLQNVSGNRHLIAQREQRDLVAPVSSRMKWYCRADPRICGWNERR